MSTLETTLLGINFPNPFVLADGFAADAIMLIRSVKPTSHC